MTMILDEKELLYIAAAINAKGFFGIPNAYFALSDKQIREAADKVRISLENKNYAVSDFDGNFQINSDVCGLVNACTSTKTYLNVTGKKNDDDAFIAFYYGNGRCVKMTKCKDGYELDYISPNDVYDTVMSRICFFDGEAENRVKIPYDYIASLDSVSVDDLMKIGCGYDMARLLSGALGGSPDTKVVSVTALDFAHRQSEDFILLSNGKNTVRAEPDNENEMVFRVITSEEIKNKIHDMCVLAEGGLYD